jgi:5'(3')-deoxyribonucleotidase
MTMLRLIPFSLMSRVCLPEPMGASPGFFRTLRVQDKTGASAHRLTAKFAVFAILLTHRISKSWAIFV